MANCVRTPMEKRFYDRAIPEPMSGCWLWIGQRGVRGYGMIGNPGRGNGHKYAHRYSLELKGIVLSELDLVLHKCDNPSCVNPDHLFVGTHQDNMDDMTAKGRHWHKGIFSEKCKKGHEFIEGNIVIGKDGFRRCRTCRNEKALSYFYKNKQKKQESK